MRKPLKLSASVFGQLYLFLACYSDAVAMGFPLSGEWKLRMLRVARACAHIHAQN